jgi:hypothetical protein
VTLSCRRGFVRRRGRAAPDGAYGVVQVAVGVAPAEPFALAMKPAITDWFGPTVAVYDIGRTVTVPLAGEYVPPHICVMVTPLGNVSVTVQPLIVEVPVLVTLISPWKAPGQAFTIRYPTEHPPGGGVVGPPGVVTVTVFDTGETSPVVVSRARTW